MIQGGSLFTQVLSLVDRNDFARATVGCRARGQGVSLLGPVCVDDVLSDGLGGLPAGDLRWLIDSDGQTDTPGPESGPVPFDAQLCQHASALAIV